MNSYLLNGVRGLVPSEGGTLTFAKGHGIAPPTYFPALRGGPFDGSEGPTDTGDQLPQQQGNEGGNDGGSSFGDIIETIVNFFADVIDFFGIEIGGGAWSGYPKIVHDWYRVYGPSAFLDWMRTHHDDKLHVPSVELQMAYLYEWLRGTQHTVAYPFHNYAERHSPGYYLFPFTEQTYSAMGIDYWPTLLTYGQLPGFPPSNGYHVVPPPFPGGWTTEAVAYANATNGQTPPPGNDNPHPYQGPPLPGPQQSGPVPHTTRPASGQSGKGGGGLFEPQPGGTSGAPLPDIVPIALAYALFSK